jgi:hypothetical protein
MHARCLASSPSTRLPLWQMNGVQLTADWSALAGVSWRF